MLSLVPFLAIFCLFLQTGRAQMARPGGSVVSWGDRVIPDIEPGTRFTKVAAGSYHSLALKRDGTVVAWGADGSSLLTGSYN
jgi:alpha-tubulin suppressor-like RCC1 family protein